MKGKFIVLEGIDGAGKGVQMKALKKFLEDEKATFYKFPDERSMYGKIIKSFLAGKVNMSPREQVMVYLTDMLNKKESIEEELSQGHIVIADRYFTSTIAYQAENKRDEKFISDIISLLDLPIPNRIIFLDIDPRESFRRRRKRDVLEKDIKFLYKVRESYMRMIKRGFPCPDWRLIDGNNPVKEITREILRQI
ncbi:MAG: dTMP kinase [Nanoarchaeota archaeon]|nr:dTMP kinase [Nanoarchaeota archaeon]